jgi:hypothetical protein
MRQQPEAEYLSDLRILRRFFRNGSLGYRKSDNVVFRTLKTRHPEAYSVFGREREKEVLGRYARSPYMEDHTRISPNTPDEDGYLGSLESPEALESLGAELENT